LLFKLSERRVKIRTDSNEIKKILEPEAKILKNLNMTASQLNAGILSGKF